MHDVVGAMTAGERCRGRVRFTLPALFRRVREALDRPVAEYAELTAGAVGVGADSSDG